MEYQKPNTEGYYWYKDIDEVNGRGTPVKFGEWDIVKAQLYSNGHYANNPMRLKKPILMKQRLGSPYLEEIKKCKGIWGKRVAKLKESDG